MGHLDMPRGLPQSEDWLVVVAERDTFRETETGGKRGRKKAFFLLVYLEQGLACVTQAAATFFLPRSSDHFFMT